MGQGNVERGPQVSGGSGKVDKVELAGDGKKRFGGAQEEMAARNQTIEKMADDTALRSRVEVNEDVVS